MFPHFEERRSDSPFVERIWSTQSERGNSFTSISTVFWSMVVSKWRGHITISLHGPETGATCKEFPAEGEWFGIAFKLGTFVPNILPGSLIDRNIVLPETSARSFFLCRSAWQFPNYENADTFVDQLVRSGILPEHLSGAEWNTYTDPLLHSARRDGEHSGRMATFVWME